ncbi:MAG: hypothetical protein R2712_15480 [Vicinamibacterales bacterium]
MADLALVRKRLQKAIEQERRDAADRRQRAQEARQAFGVFLDERAIPAFRAVAVVLKSEGLPWEVMTPSDEVRLVPDRRRDESIAVSFDATADPPQPMVSVTRGRGSRTIHTERPVKPGIVTIDALTEEDVVEMLIEELRPWLG